MDKSTSTTSQEEQSKSVTEKDQSFFTTDQVHDLTRKILEDAEIQWTDREKKLTSIERKISSSKKEIDFLKKEVFNQNSRNIEILGIFSGILALIIVDVNIIKSAPNFLAAILLVTALTTSLVIFISIIHSFFRIEKKNEDVTKILKFSMSILIILIVIGIITQLIGKDLYNLKRDIRENSEIEKINNTTVTQ